MDLSGKIELVNVSDVGRRRPHNEDCCAANARIGLAVVADGMGGYKAGEVASAIAVSSIVERIRAGLADLPPGEYDDATGYAKESLVVQGAIAKANTTIYEVAQRDSRCEGMGTTVVLSLFYDDRVTIAHVGDSRLYRLRTGHFEQLTVDHSLVQEIVKRGLLTPEEALTHTPKNLLTKALGIEASVQADVLEDIVLPGDLYLMCTDGLNDMLGDEEIYLILQKYGANLVKAAEELVDKANAAGGHDNVSVLLARPTEQFSARSGWYEIF